MIRALLALCFAAVTSVAHQAFAETAFPTRPIRFVLPYAPGGPTDAIARAVGRNMEQALKVPVVVENRPGGQGVIAMQAVSSSKPDGYTIGLAPGNAFTTNRILMKDLPYRLDDFKLITTLYRGGVVLAVPKSSPASTLKEFVELARKDARPQIFGTGGPGGASHLTMEQFASITGMRVQMVAYKGDAPMVLDVLGGTLPAAMVTVSVTGEHHKRGALRILAITSAEQMEAYPDVPTFRQAGYPEIETYFWAGTVAPAGTPDAVVGILQKAIANAMHGPEVKSVLTPDIVPFTGGEKEFRDFVTQDFNKWNDLVRDRNIVIR
ncbi:MAG: Bug family tripartite tricarboxylate transporter substrate binding protein [Burkholderiaceae bacterium]